MQYGRRVRKNGMCGMRSRISTKNREHSKGSGLVRNALTNPLVQSIMSRREKYASSVEAIQRSESLNEKTDGSRSGVKARRAVGQQMGKMKRCKSGSEVGTGTGG